MARISDANRVFPFFVSCGRSGSTLLRSMFDSHPEMAVPGESYFITELLPRLPIYQARGFDTPRFIEDVLKLSYSTRPEVVTWIDRWGIDQSTLTKEVLDASPASYPEAIRAVFRCYADWKGKPLYGDKTPAYITGMKTIAKLLPEARFVHLVRDGRDVALAFLAAPFGPRTIEEIALHWRARTLAGREAGSRMGDRYMEVKYEDLVARPEEALGKVCDWLGLSFYPQMLDHRNSVKGLGLGFDTAHKNVLRPLQKGMRDWRKQMTGSDVERFELVAGDALEAFGYDRARPNPGIGNRAVVGARRFHLAGRKLSRRIRGLNSADWW